MSKNIPALTTRARICSSWNQNTSWVYTLKISRTFLRLLRYMQVVQNQSQKTKQHLKSQSPSITSLSRTRFYPCICKRSKDTGWKTFRRFSGLLNSSAPSDTVQLVTTSSEIWLPEKSIFRRLQSYHSKDISQLFWEQLGKILGFRK